jgi:hypothetical protein
MALQWADLPPHLHGYTAVKWGSINLVFGFKNKRLNGAQKRLYDLIYLIYLIYTRIIRDGIGCKI